MPDEKKPQKEAASPPEQEVPFADRHRNLLTVLVVGGLMLIEGVGIVVATKLMGGDPGSSSAAEAIFDGPVDEMGRPLPAVSEVYVTDLAAFNSQEGRVYVYQLSIYAQVDTNVRIEIAKFFERRKNAIDDRLSRLIRAADPKYLSEPGLETMRRQVKHELDQLLKDDTIIQLILFPEFSKSRAD